MTSIQEELFAMQDLEYRAFQCKLMPTVMPENVIGVRTPLLRKYAASLSKTPEAAAFLHSLPHRYYDENQLHAFLIERMKVYAEAVEAVELFLPYVDNWATCDMLSPKVFKKNTELLYKKIPQWLASAYTYTVRFGIEMLMSFYLDENFLPEMPAMVAQLRSEEYYINMMIAWYFATALAKQYDAVLPYITGRKLAPWVHNKTIQKAIESYRIDDATKIYLRTLKL